MLCIKNARWMPDIEALAALIRNDAWMVRHYSRGARGACKIQREQAIQKLYETIRYAITQLDGAAPAECEVLLVAIVDGLRPIERAAF